MKDDGGPAFPRTPFDDKRTAGGIYGEEGMSLRDYFAAMAMQGILHDALGLRMPEEQQTIVQTAYQLADAMVAQRKAGEA